MSLERIAIVVAGREVVEWQSVEIAASVDEAVRTAALRMHVAPGGSPPWPGQPVTISSGGSVLLTGYVRDFAPEQETDTWSATVTFVSKTIDAVECSIVHPSGLVKGKDIAGIAREFDTCRVGVEAVGQFEVHERHQINPGESLFETIEPLAWADGALIHDTASGKLKISNETEGDHSGGLAIGVNIVSGSAQFSEQDKFDPVTSRGQQSRGEGAQALRPEAEASDPSVGRYRPKIIIMDTEATAGKLKRSAEWQARKAAGRAVSAEIAVKGWRDAGGRIWTPNFRVYVRHPRLFLDQMMAISSVRLLQDTASDSDGTMAVLSLVDPRALGGKSAGGKSGAGWSAPEPKATYRAN